MSEHTPGPWKLGEMRDGFQFIDAADGSWYEFASVAHTPLHPRLNEIAKANARLIAAAPETAADRDRLRALNAELLEALKPFAALADEIEQSCRQYAPPDDDPENWSKSCEWEHLVAARAAIAKARLAPPTETGK